MPLQIEVDPKDIAAFCRRRGISELAIFGSAVRGDFRPESDVDVLVTFQPSAKPGLVEIMEIEDELARLFGRRVDVVTRDSVERSRNYIFRDHVLGNLEPLYVA